MPFTSTVFFLVYLPAVLIGYYSLGRRAPMWAAGWLFVASVAFYGYSRATEEDFQAISRGSVSLFGTEVQTFNANCST
jgi:hypothetical protein